MKPLKEMDVLIMPDGSQHSIKQLQEKDRGFLGVFKNDVYLVMKRRLEHKTDPQQNIIWLSVKRNDKEPIHDWRDLQQIKNELVGEENEGMEIYPAESRKADSANQYHLWVFEDPSVRIPFGFQDRLVTGPEEAEKIGAKQRPFEENS